MRALLLPLMLLLFGASSKLIAQDAQMWRTLSKITYEKQFDELLGFKVDVPVFSQEIKDLEAEIIEISGYIVPVEGYKSHTEFVFSAYPYNMCFFCGGAGPETVMEVTAKEPVKYSTERIKLRGKLLLNGDDINRLMYIMIDAELVKDSGPKVVDGGDRVDGVVAELVSGPEDLTTLHAPASEPEAEPVGIMVPALGTL